MNFENIYYCFMFLIPGLYLASKNNFLISPNPKYRNFFVRCIFLIPCPFILTLLMSLIFGFILSKIFVGFEQYTFLISPLVVVAFSIFIFKKYLLRKDLPPEYWSDFEEHELYVYSSLNEFSAYSSPYLIRGGNVYGTKFDFPKVKNANELFLPIQKENLILDLNSLQKKNIHFASTHFNEIIVSQYGLEILEKNGVGGFKVKPVKNNKISESGDEIVYYQLFSESVMSPFSPQTEIIRKTPQLRQFILSNQFFYDSNILENSLDFNQSYEIFGSEIYQPPPHRLWVVSHKTMKVLINDLNQHRRDFIPIHLINNEQIQESQT